MNKLVIPTILTATVLIAGIFAFIPVDNAFTVHEDIIAAITNSQDAVLLDLEKKLKLSSDTDTSTAVSTNNDATVTIRALDDGQPTTFNLKECYLKGTASGANGDTIEVTAITIDGLPLSDAINGGLTDFGPRTDAGGAGISTVELLSGMNFTTGLGADDTITMTVRVDVGDVMNEVTCISFVQNSADLEVVITDPPEN